MALRVERHVENARRVAEFLRGDPRVEWVNYAGFADNPYHALAQKYLGGRACSLLTFGVKGGFEAGKKFYDALKLIKRLVNMGDAKSLACHPASTTHRQMSAEEQRKAGVQPGDDPAQHRHRAYRRHHRRSRSGARRHREPPAGTRRGVSNDARFAGPGDVRHRAARRLTRTSRRADFRGCRSIELLVNNMPDAALEATERQFVELLDAAPAITGPPEAVLAAERAARAKWRGTISTPIYADIESSGTVGPTA